MAEDKVRIESLQPGLQAFEPSQPFCSMERTNWEFGKYLHSRLCTGSCPPRHGMGACFSARIWRE